MMQGKVFFFLLGRTSNNLQKVIDLFFLLMENFWNFYDAALH